MTTTAHILDGNGYREVKELGELPALLAQPSMTVWLDTDERTDALCQVLVDVLRLHPLVLEDLFSDSNNPKVEDWGEYLYIVVHGVRQSAEDKYVIKPLELDLVIGTNWVFTHRSAGFVAVKTLETELRRNPRALTRGPAYVAHALLDKLTDTYLPIAEFIDEEVDLIEKAVIDDPKPELLETMFSVKRAVQYIRRQSVYQRDITQRLSRGEFEQIPEAALAFYRDLYDQFVRVTDIAESNREMLAVALQAHFTVTANRTNDAMKALTIISGLLMPQTVIAGVFGMNFENIPGLKSRVGFSIAIVLMLATSLAFYSYFKRKRWI
jgi:magnesium transporter